MTTETRLTLTLTILAAIIGTALNLWAWSEMPHIPVYPFKAVL